MKTIPKTLCICFNGPPGVGKDTLVDKLVELADTPLVVGTLADIVRTKAEGYYNYPGFARLATSQGTKDVYDGMLGKTPREALIHYSENIVKPVQGPNVWAVEFAKSLQGCKHAVMTDLGFAPEAGELCKVFDLVITVQLHHTDFNFDKDSRSYIDQQATNNVILEFPYTRDGNIEREVGILEKHINHALGLAIDNGLVLDN